ncbi:MotA/TolQ/ExbB proton channel family protein [Fulvimarina pelagi HTCC2506]|uniref:MotA/TolQ/ExbB proton channel family protein n=1 Tax=Fulvimarina pelagi HTCC2506 TaxID=314231 RepID=Q0G354_9HYPH|nr:MotA/TolQ/ExbB proton channel family protein [Fulvimarina pelagi]EAU41977.1 MotA/TolQ/ExbB proton channel family protein [Fulvimarina pelagi HTCC2506]
MNASLLIQPVLQIYELGGFVVVILAALSVVAFAVVLLKLWQFSREGVGKRRASRQAVDAWVRGDTAKALKAAEGGRGPVAGVVASAIRGAMTRSLARQTIEEDVQRIATERLHSLGSGLRLLEAIAQIAPLLGLFGTVLGMIEAFQAMQNAGSDVDPSQLAGGIWVALLTTAVGLAVAMPSQLLTTWFDGRIENERVAMETAIAAIFTRSVTDRAIGTRAASENADRTASSPAEARLAPGE